MKLTIRLKRRRFRTSLKAVVTATVFVSVSGYAQPLPKKNQCTPVTPETKIPFIEAPLQYGPNPASFEWCEDIDYAWTPQSYPNVKFVPKRDPEHVERIEAFLQALKDFIVSDSDDWVSYINEKFGTQLPAPEISKSHLFSNRTYSIYSQSFLTNGELKKFKANYETLNFYGSSNISEIDVPIGSKRNFSVKGLNTVNFCITPIDLKKYFDVNPDSLMRPSSNRPVFGRERPTADEVVKLGGQWTGYEMYIFSSSSTNQNEAQIYAGFGFKPCAVYFDINAKKSKIKE